MTTRWERAVALQHEAAKRIDAGMSIEDAVSVATIAQDELDDAWREMTERPNGEWTAAYRVVREAIRRRNRRERRRQIEQEIDALLVGTAALLARVPELAVTTCHTSPILGEGETAP